MKGKLLFGAGIAAGYVLGSRSGRAAYERLKARTAGLWASQPVQDTLSAAAGAVKDKAPEVTEQLGEAARRAGTVIVSAVRSDAPKGTTADVESDPALNDQHGQDWSDEGGATPAGAATNIDPDRVS
ncbi:hypothetical protein QK292_05660 [Arthrobacter sp. AL08]|uniref:hypothetical protein n=1 Tax=Micrococcaceae TaxID=1268 RepID=UPI001CFF9F7B|nr:MULTISPECIES: hypothetical protein [Micrococcaceae]MDI3240962.1 hypothetical protein [Arthrobacter sp. AL05]MDI3277062.1 hypothetical protein [Arthrobacter sp. AL08]MDJ0352311.1 hypothetical protein [Pseudarthrobacter sp. PH31-O2]WGZ79592.1 hypothetical protein QI450_17480 [Arthrobacter sp. EM1]